MTYDTTINLEQATKLLASALHAGLDIYTHLRNRARTIAEAKPATAFIPAPATPAPVAAAIPPAPVYENDEDFLASLSLR
jgi:hypothetical protein